jgi:hypothetical protein
MNSSSGLYLLEVINSQITTNGYNYTLPALTENKLYSAQLMARELSESGTDDVLASSWSSSLAISIYKPDNEMPVSVAKAGIFINGQGIFSDIIKGAKTGDEITYSGADSYDPDGEIVEYSWRIIDSRGQQIDLLGNKNEKTFKKIYNEPGTYLATLTVTDNRGGVHTWPVDVIVSKSGGYDDGEEDEEGYENTMLLAVAGAIAAIGIIGGLVVNKLGIFGGNDSEDIFEDFTPGPLELNCPTCNGLISITTTQRPIQVGCPMCQSQFVIRE